MNLSGLSFDKIPPLDVPLRFFLTAPFFGIIAGLIILFSGSELWASRWHPATLALTHSLTLGVITMTMAGALLQLLPVLAGQGVHRVRRLAGLTHSGLVIGSLLLTISFITPLYWHSATPWLKGAALACLGLSLLSYTLSLARLLFNNFSDKTSLNAMRLGLLAFIITIGLGIVLLLNNLWPQWFSLSKAYTDLHAGWGLVGWVSLLIMAVSFQVLPMFHVAPSFPARSGHWLPGTLFLLLLLKLAYKLLDTSSAWDPLVSLVLATGIKLCLAIYALLGLWVLWQRKRKIADTTVNCWYLAFISLLAVLVLSSLPSSLAPDNRPLIEGALLIFAFVVTIIIGMLIKIVPFLAYLHLQQACGMSFNAMAILPNIHQLMPQVRGQWLFRLHLMTLLSLLVTLAWPRLYSLTGLLMILEFAFLASLMIPVLQTYRRIREQINQLVRQEQAQ